MFLRKLNVPSSMKPHHLSSLYKSTFVPLTADLDGGSLSSSSPRSFDEIPGPKGLPILGSYLDYIKPGGFRFEKYFEAVDKRYKDYGPIYKENIFGKVTVTLTDLEEYMKVIRIDGKYPEKEKIIPLYHYKDMRVERHNIVNKHGPEWAEERQLISMKLMRPHDIIQHIAGIDEVTEDFLNRLSTGLKSQFRPLPEVDGLLYRTSFSTINSATQHWGEKSPITQVSLKPFNSMPGPKGLPVLGTLVEYLRPGGLKFNKMFEVMHNRNKLYGPIYKENIGGFTSVVISDIEEYAKIMKIDGKYPIRVELGPIWYYRKIRGMDLGIVNSQSEQWLGKRQILSPKLLKPPEILQHVNEIDKTTSDFLDLMRSNFGSSMDDGSFVCRNLEHNLFLWALESVSIVLFGTRIGCLNKPAPPQADKFIKSLLGSFETMQALMYGIPVYQVYPTKTWRKFEKHYGDLVDVGRQLVEENKKHLKSSSSDILNYLLTQTSIDPDVANLTCIDIMNGAVETTSNGILWSLYCLGRNPEAQEALYQETLTLLSNPDDDITGDIFAKLKYVRACLKEALRLYPITFATSRVIQTDVEVFNYFIPAGTHCQGNLFSMGQDKKHFPDPESFRPERWLRGDQFNPILNTLSTLPFGHGPRMCIGRRLAEMEIYIMLTKLIRNFRIEWVDDGEVKPILHTVMIPEGPIIFKFTPRN